MDPYKAGMFKENPYALKREIQANLVVVLQGKLENRGLSLITPISRAVLKDEIHELIITDDPEAGPGKKVDRIAYAGFMEISAGGVVVVGDEVTCDGETLGRIAGFDETHMPNHENIVLFSKKRTDGVEMNLQLESRVRIKQPK